MTKPGPRTDKYGINTLRIGISSFIPSDRPEALQCSLLTMIKRRGLDIGVFLDYQNGKRGVRLFRRS